MGAKAPQPIPDRYKKLVRVDKDNRILPDQTVKPDDEANGIRQVYRIVGPTPSAPPPPPPKS